MRFQKVIAVVTLCFLLAGCIEKDIETMSTNKNIQEIDNTSKVLNEVKEEAVVPSEKNEEEIEKTRDIEPYQNHYIVSLADNILKDILPQDEKDPSEKVRYIYEYLVTNCTFADPVGIDVWQIRGDPQEIPTFLELHALSPLAFNLGSCEDYAAAMVLLCTRAGIEAEYLPGLTYSVEGELVDHAWALVKVKGNWYHVDPQLERNIVHNGILRYRFFMKDDDSMYPGHLWGENLQEHYQTAGIERTPEQQALLKKWTPESCTDVLPDREYKQITLSPAPDIDQLIAQLNQERIKYEEEHGVLDKVDVNWDPPKV